MKRFAIIGCLVVCALFLATQVMADTFSVTANFGVRVTERGKCEQVGSITLSPQGGTSGTSMFRGEPTDTIIRIELLAGAKVCKKIDARYMFGGSYVTTGGDYRIEGNVGEDFYKITVYNDGPLKTEQLIVGHDEHSPLCFNLENTPYKPDTPQNQLVQVSYKDDKNNTYSGDPYVATVKPSAHVVSACAKTEVGVETGKNWGITFLTNKDALPSIPLCLTTSTNAQTQSTTCAGGTRTICIKVTDPDNVFQRDMRYDFNIGRIPPKTGVLTGIGIDSAAIYRKDSSGVWEVRSFTITERYDTTGAKKGTGWDSVKTARIDGYVTMLGSGTHYIILTVKYDCTATPAQWLMDVAAARYPCGDSFSKEDVPVVNLVSCTGEVPVATYEAIFPYSPNFTNKVWWTGLALTNMDSTANTVNVTIYEADGDKYTATVMIPAYGIKLGLFSDTTFINPVAASGVTDAKFGDEPFWVMVKSTKKFSGFIMMGNGNEAQGNLPLQNWGYGSSW